MSEIAIYSGRISALHPLVHRHFRETSLASLPSNLALSITGVGAAWAMTVLTDSALMVACVHWR